MSDTEAASMLSELPPPAAAVQRAGTFVTLSKFVIADDKTAEVKKGLPSSSALSG
jgi:hypothetical protein